MEQFSLEKYLANPERKIVTREGRSARILCTDYKSDACVVAAVSDKNGYERIIAYLENGRVYFGTDSPNDLFFAPKEPIVGYAAASNAWSTEYGQIYRLDTGIYKTAKQAKEIIDLFNSCSHHIVKVTIEEIDDEQK